MKIFEGPDHIDDANVPWTDLFREDFHVRVYNDGFPVTRGHLLFVPTYNTVETLMIAMRDAINFGQAQIRSTTWDGFNIGMNYGEAAGQTVMWPHVHLIPRRTGDTKNPRGGVRHVIPGKGNYEETK